MSCNNCKNYSALVEPRELDENIVIYGYCFKRTGFINTGYPVYILEGKCKEHSPETIKRVRMEGQMSFDDFPEVMP